MSEEWHTIDVDKKKKIIRYKGVFHAQKSDYKPFWKGYPTGYNSTNNPLDEVEEAMHDLMPEFVDFDVECVVTLKKRKKTTLCEKEERE